MKAFIFDLDGTLIDSLADLAEAVNRMLDDRGYPRQPISVFPKYVGDGVRALVERALPSGVLASEDVDARVNEYQKHYSDTWKSETRPYVGIEEALQALQERGMKLAVLSNKPHVFTKLCCDHFFPNTKFELVLGARSGVPKKPDPAGALEIAEHLGLAPSECAYVGDSDIDMKLAVNAGMLAVGVKWGFRGEAELRANGAVEVVGTPDDLVCLVNGVC
ncbi:MAG: HAD family hydrolase [Verrucomicrobium sp.]